MPVVDIVIHVVFLIFVISLSSSFYLSSPPLPTSSSLSFSSSSFSSSFSPSSLLLFPSPPFLSGTPNPFDPKLLQLAAAQAKEEEMKAAKEEEEEEEGEEEEEEEDLGGGSGGGGDGDWMEMTLSPSKNKVRIYGGQ